jgi:nucleoside-diphosphate-sugar epimerase
MKHKIFLTGASGFIGSHITEEFANKNYLLKLFLRKESPTKFLNGIIRKSNVTKSFGDVIDKKSLEEAMKGCDVIIHNAAKVDDWGSYDDFYNINVKGTRNVLQAAKKNKIQQFILISSNSVIGEEDCKTPKNEKSNYKPKYPYFLENIFPSAMNHYRYTKMLSEKEAINFCSVHNINLIVIRPVWVYGPRELHAGHYYFAKSRLEGNRFFPASKNTLFHTIYVKDLSNIVFQLTNKGLTGINIFNVGSKKVNTLTQFWGEICKKLRRTNPIYLPKWIIYPIGLMMELTYTLFGSKKAPLLTRARVNMGYSNNIYDTKKIHSLIRFKETKLSDGVSETIKWWRDNGYL